MGGSISMSGCNFGCFETVTVYIVDPTGAKAIATLGTAIQPCETFTQEFTIAKIVVPGQ